jgi:hypothetical protein
MSLEIQVYPASATVKTTTTKSVATEVCDSGSSLIPVNIDCSLCSIGFPQSGGTVGITFFGPFCEDNSYPEPSTWLGPQMKMAGWQCPDPGFNAEPDPNQWKAIGYFSGVVHNETCYRKYRFISTLSALAPSKISVSVVVQTLIDNGNGTSSWVGYSSFSDNLTEIYNSNTSVYRVRNFNSPNFIPITVSNSGGKGDPVSYAKIMVILLSMRNGCDGFDNQPPTCGFWDGSRWLTCLQAFVKTRTDTTIRGFGQLGFRTPNCGSPTSNYCECDEFTLTAISPNTGNAYYNNTNDFFIDYGVLGIAGGVESIGAVQQIQFGRVGDFVMGGIVNIAVKMIGGSIYCCTNDGTGWVCSSPTVVQANSPHIMLYQPAGKDYDLIIYGMQFPNPNILSEQCSGSGQVPSPSPNDPYWCVGSECVQSPVQPSGARAGPYGLLAECNAYCVLGQIPYWCWYGKCVQRITQPTGSTGPFANSSACGNGGCGPEVMVYTCNASGNCQQTPKWAAIQDDLEYWNTLELCQQNCVQKWYCASDGNCYQWTKTTAPPWATSGPYSTQTACQSNCVPVVGSTVYQSNYEEPTTQIHEPITENQSEIIKRIKLPCIHLGESITGTNKMGCGSCHTHKCSIHGECKKFDSSGQFKQCITCEDYSNG